jgi:hypothetical protein
MTAKQPTVHDMKTIADMARPPGAPRLTKDGRDLDAIEAEGIRRDLELQREREGGELGPVKLRLDAVTFVAEARKRARLAAGILEDVLGAVYEDQGEALQKLRQARAMLGGAAEMLAVFEEQP